MTNLAERFESKYERIPFSGCWIWLAHLDRYGYGVFSIKHRCTSAHKFPYERLFGKVPRTLELDHLCRVRCCVNPDHLEAVTHRVNMLRGKIALQTICKHGHPFDEKNTYTFNGKRACRICKARLSREYQQRQKAKLIEQGLS
jgi:hypothetical protein